MYTALFLVALLYLFTVRDTQKPLYRYSVLGAIAVLFPLAGSLLKAYFQGFYEKDSLLWLLPVAAVIAYTIILVYNKQWNVWKKRLMMPFVCILVALCGYMSGGLEETGEQSSYEEEITGMYDWILEHDTKGLILLAGPEEIIQDARAYDGRLMTVYGRDLWEQELTPYFYDSYDPYMYALHDHMEEPLEENQTQLLEELEQAGASYAVFDKDNLTFGEDMQYPASLGKEGYRLDRMAETRHYVIYWRTSPEGSNDGK